MCSISLVSSHPAIQVDNAKEPDFADCVIVGGGASSLMLAAMLDIRAYSKRGLILERTDRLGTKLLISGGGHCNITHDGSIKDFIGHYRPSGKFFRKILYRHNNIAFVKWLESGGVRIRVEDDGRIFPKSMNSSEVLEFLVHKVKANGWEIRKEIQVTDIYERTKGAKEYRIDASNVVIATGGITYPKTGSDGSMFSVLRKMGIEITPLKSALTPVKVKDYPFIELAGVSMTGVKISVSQKSIHLHGDILFTHNGFSGPAILNLSGDIESGDIITISYNRKLEDMPKRLRKVLEDRARGKSGDISTKKLDNILISDSFEVESLYGNGMVTRGGIGLSEIDAGTMQLKRYPGIFACGEVLDAAGDTGGYNFQFCYSTAAAIADCLSSKFSNNQSQIAK